MRANQLVKGYVYLAHSTSSKIYKIGMTNDVKSRVRELSSSCKEKLELIHSFPSNDCRKSEKTLHVLFSSKKVKGEWFRLDDSDVDKIVGINGDDDIVPIYSLLCIEPPSRDGRHMFAISDSKIAETFVNRCKCRMRMASVVLTELMRLYNSGELDSIVFSDKDEEKENE